MENVTVLIVTFNRPKMIRKTIYGFLKNHNYNLDFLQFHIADNDTGGRCKVKNYVQDIMRDFDFLQWSYTIEKKHGWGNNVNTALKKIKNNFIFLIEDDRMAYNTINITNGVRLLQSKKDVGLVRYDGIAGHTGTVMQLKEIKTKDYRFSYCEINQWQSSRPITYSNQPHLRHVRFTNHYGYYPEGVTLGRCERIYALRVKRSPSGPKIAILEDGIQNRFHHLGAGKNSRQHTKWDK